MDRHTPGCEGFQAGGVRTKGEKRPAKDVDDMDDRDTRMDVEVAAASGTQRTVATRKARSTVDNKLGGAVAAMDSASNLRAKAAALIEDAMGIAAEMRAAAAELIRQAEMLEAVVARVMARKGRQASSTAAAADETPKRARRSGVRRTETKARWEVIRDHVFNNYGDHPFLVCDVVEVLKLKKGDFWNSVQKAGFERVDRGQYRLPAEKMKGVGDEED